MAEDGTAMILHHAAFQVEFIGDRIVGVNREIWFPVP
jgi:hypothetical protein